MSKENKKTDSRRNIEDDIETYDGKAQKKRDLSVKDEPKEVRIRKDHTEPLEDQEDITDKEGDFN